MPSNSQRFLAAGRRNVEPCAEHHHHHHAHHLSLANAILFGGPPLFNQSGDPVPRNHGGQTIRPLPYKLF